MRPLEILLFLATAAGILRGTLLAGVAWPGWSPVMPVAVAAILALHLILEGWRGQMLPAYVVVGAWLVLQAAEGLQVIPGPLLEGVVLRMLGAGASALLLAAAGGLCMLRPVIQTPAPIGPFPVGTTAIPLFPGATQASPVFRVWYPAQPGSGQGAAPYAVEPRQALRRNQLSRSRSAQEAALVPGSGISSPGRLPVLVYFPGWGGVPSQGTVLIQDLASHGYVVAAPDAWDPAAYPHDPGAAADVATPLMFDSDLAAEVSMAAGARNAPRQARLARLVIDRLTDLNRADPAGRFTRRLDLDRIGMLGFSFGGSVAVETAVDDPRVRAVANLDGGVFTDAYLRGFPQPYLLVSEPPMTEADLRSPNPVTRREAIPTLEDEARIKGFMERWGGTRAIIQGMAHVNFQDAPLLKDGRRVGGTINPQRARLLVDRLLLTFFDHHLRGTSPPISADISSAYPEMDLQVWHPATRADAAVGREPVQAQAAMHALTDAHAHQGLGSSE